MKFSERVDQVMCLTPAEMTARLREIELAERELSAEKAALVAVADAVGTPGDDGHASSMGWLVAHTNCSKGDAVKVRKLARLCNHVEEVADAISEARIGMSQAHELARAFAKRGRGRHLAGVADRLVVAAEHLDFADFRTHVKRWEAGVDPDGAETDTEIADAGRSAHVVEVEGGVDVRASGGDPLAATEMVSVFERYVEAEFHIDAERAEREHGPDVGAAQFARTAEQRRFDALRSIFSDAVAAPADGKRPEPIVNVVVSHEMFEAGLARHDLFDADAVPSLPRSESPLLDELRCETSRGAIVPQSAMVLAALTGRVRRVVLDRNGRVADLGRSRRLFTKAQREAAALLPTSCSWPGCFVPAELCQTDHLDEWSRDGGPTDLANAAPACRRHNRFKSVSGVRSRPTALGTILHRRSDDSAMLPVGTSPPPMPDPTRRARRRRDQAPAPPAVPPWSWRSLPVPRSLDELFERFGADMAELAPAS